MRGVGGGRLLIAHWCSLVLIGVAHRSLVVAHRSLVVAHRSLVVAHLVFAHQSCLSFQRYPSTQKAPTQSKLGEQTAAMMLEPFVDGECKNGRGEQCMGRDILGERREDERSKTLQDPRILL